LPKTGAVVGHALAVAGITEPLTGESPADEVDGGELSGSDCSDIFEPLSMGPMFRQHGTTEPVVFYLPEHGAEACSFEAEFETADSREEAPDRQRHPKHTSPSGFSGAGSVY
jgi:hypothetical protein